MRTEGTEAGGMSEQIYVVMGSTGEFSDRTEWPLRAYRSEAAAQAEVERMHHEINVRIGGRSRHDLRWEERDGIEKEMKQLDPQFEMDYTGTHYFIYTVTLAD
jgi:hypothetical protein